MPRQMTRLFDHKRTVAQEQCLWCRRGDIPRTDDPCWICDIKQAPEVPQIAAQSRQINAPFLTGLLQLTNFCEFLSSRCRPEQKSAPIGIQTRDDGLFGRWYQIESIAGGED